mmetsp:Transcript_83000/g.267469  ORF Transcript_83000/g.267469 Transcript_83000/m.267469 type:complete len:135 (-) Transcript_83000:1771-2175(-)
MASSVLLLVTACLLSTVGAFGDASDCLGECAESQQEETNLLQRTLLEHRPLRTGDGERKASVALTFPGGGLLALSKHAWLKCMWTSLISQIPKSPSLSKQFVPWPLRSSSWLWLACGPRLDHSEMHPTASANVL